MIVLGIDPGVASVGFGAVRSEYGKLARLVHGVIKTPARVPLARRLLLISEDMNELLDKLNPDHVAVEQLYFSKNITTGIPVAHARGVILLEAARRGLPVYEYGPMQVKQAVVGYGAADKKQMMAMIKLLLSMDKNPRPDDAADALGVAVCHAQTIRGV
jgi:crossover junction endodeoxyribonuclease RuvC